MGRKLRGNADFRNVLVAALRNRAAHGWFDGDEEFKQLCLSREGFDPHVALGLIMASTDDEPRRTWILAELGKFWRPSPKPYDSVGEGPKEIIVRIATWAGGRQLPAPARNAGTAKLKSANPDDDNEKEDTKNN